MYLAPEGQELEIAEAARTYLGDCLPLARLKGASHADMPSDTRREMAQLGWFGLAVDEARGGSGLSEVEHALFFREVGRQCGPIAILAQCLAANAAQDDKLRASLLSGEQGCALLVRDRGAFRALGAPDARYGVLAEPGICFIHDLANLVDDCRPALDRADSMRLLSALPSRIETLESGRPYRFGQLGVAAMLIGIAEAALDLIVEYAKIRETFGRKIGAWQAVRHPCADMAVRVEAARAQLWFAAAACKECRADADAHLTAAKHLANEAAYRNADTNIQLHGGIGVTEEHDAHLLLKRALMLGRLFGAREPLLNALLHAELVD